MNLVFIYSALAFLFADLTEIITQQEHPITTYQYLLLEEDRFDFDEVIDSQDFITLSNENLNFGINNDIVWLKYVIQNKTINPEKYFLINNPSLDSLELYVVQDKKIIQEFRGGRLLDFSLKPIPSKHIIFKINLSSLERVFVGGAKRILVSHSPGGKTVD